MMPPHANPVLGNRDELLRPESDGLLKIVSRAAKRGALEIHVIFIADARLQTSSMRGRRRRTWTLSCWR